MSELHAKRLYLQSSFQAIHLRLRSDRDEEDDDDDDDDIKEKDDEEDQEEEDGGYSE